MPVVQLSHAGSKNTGKRGVKTTRSVMISLCLLGSMIVLFGVGRVYWDERYYVPEEGFGYGLGLTGGILMLFAYAYAFVKHSSGLRQKGLLLRSLSLHIVFGVVGVYLIVIHSTFHIGSINGGVALVSALLVFVSGVIGRFLYTRIHYGIGNRHLIAMGIEEELSSFESSSAISQRTQEMREKFLQRRFTLSSAMLTYLSFPLTRRKMLRELSRDLDDVARSLMNHYLDTLHRLIYLRIYESFFRIWRYAHMPLLVLLFASGSIHVFAVHVY